MRVPIRKPGKYTHQKLDPYLTEVKFRELKKNLERLKKIHPHLATEVKRLALDGDFSENAAYQLAKGKLRGVNQKILDIENYLKKAIIIKFDKNKDAIQLGHKVTVEIAGEQKIYLILGSSETDPLKGIISHNSPIGSALMGRKVGDTVKIIIANEEIDCKIIKIE